MMSGSGPRAVWVVLAGACSLIFVSGCGGSSGTEAATRSASASALPEIGCKKPGIRYAGTTAPGVEVCFTMSPDGGTWLERGFRFLRGRGCPGGGPAAVYFPQPAEGSGPARFIEEGFTARIRGARATGVFENPDFCRGKKFEWSARATQPLPTRALATLGPFATNACKKRGIHYAGQTARDAVEICFTISFDRRHLVESGWSFERPSGCEDEGAVWRGYQGEVDAAGRFDEPDGLSGTIRGSRASGELSDYEHCRTFKWSAQRAR
jgi:hypothetical protein